MLPTIIGKIGLPFLASVLGGVLAGMDSPAARSAGRALGRFENAVNGGDISDAQIAEANRHAQEMAKVKARENEVALKEVNKSLRAELASDDAYVRRMRPTFGYLMAATWAAQMLGVAYIMVFRTDDLDAVLRGMEGLSAIWAVGLSVLGIYVYKRSEEKRGSAGSGFSLGSVASVIAPKVKSEAPMPPDIPLPKKKPSAPRVNK